MTGLELLVALQALSSRDIVKNALIAELVIPYFSMVEILQQEPQLPQIQQPI
jgi:hypothetical protein